jgi:hypothetical protein
MGYKINDIVTLEPSRTKKKNLVGYYFVVTSITMHDGSQILEVVPFGKQNAMPIQYLYDREVVLSRREKNIPNNKILAKLMEWCGFI